MVLDLKRIFNFFIADGTFLQGGLYGNGHIHDTYLIRTAEEDKDDYILQRLNNHIFKNIPHLQNNIERVTDHLRSRLLIKPGSNIKRECLNLIETINGKTWINDRDGSYWRMYIFITNHKSYDIVDSADKAFEGGKAIGRFQVMLSDLGGEPLFETIPYFHDIEKRLEVFYSKVKTNPVRRAESVKNEISFAFERAEAMKVIHKLETKVKYLCE